MLESGLSGSVRGVRSNTHPYRDPGSFSTDSAGIVGRLMSALAQPRRCRAVVGDFGRGERLRLIRRISGAKITRAGARTQLLQFALPWLASYRVSARP